MPHQVILCKDETYCSSEYMIVSLYDYQYYIQNFETLLTYENNGIDFSDIHSLSQGKYVTVAISESKPNMTKIQNGTKSLASYASQKAEGYVCGLVSENADKFPVCGTIKFFSQHSSGFWDLFQNTPSSISGLNNQSYGMVGLGGNVNSVTI